MIKFSFLVEYDYCDRQVSSCDKGNEEVKIISIFVYMLFMSKNSHSFIAENTIKPFPFKGGRGFGKYPTLTS